MALDVLARIKVKNSKVSSIVILYKSV